MNTFAIKWSGMYILLFFIFLHVLFEVHNRVQESFFDTKLKISSYDDSLHPLLNVITNKNNQYKEIVKEFFKPLETESIMKSIPTLTAAKLKDPNMMFVVMDNASIFCNDVSAPFIVEKFILKMESENINSMPVDRCVLQINKTRLNEQDLIQFISSYVPGMNRISGSANTMGMKGPLETSAVSSWAKLGTSNTWFARAGNSTFTVETNSLMSLTYAPGVLFDAINNINNFWWSTTGFNGTVRSINPASVILTLPYDYVISDYSITTTSNLQNAPRTWELAGLNKNGVWELINVDNYRDWKINSSDRNASVPIKFIANSGKSYKTFKWSFYTTMGGDSFQIRKIFVNGSRV